VGSVDYNDLSGLIFVDAMLDYDVFIGILEDYPSMEKLQIKLPCIGTDIKCCFRGSPVINISRGQLLRLL
jgi:hypothetical protein